jgi:DNA-binding MarR family transcriptional regulator
VCPLALLTDSPGEARERIRELVARRLLHDPGDHRAPITLTEHGQRLHGQIRAAATQVTDRLWGGLPVEDLATAGRVLDTVLARANAELADA